MALQPLHWFKNNSDQRNIREVIAYFIHFSNFHSARNICKFAHDCGYKLWYSSSCKVLRNTESLLIGTQFLNMMLKMPAVRNFSRAASLKF